MATRYHHGDLAAALVTAGVELARESGPDGVVLREATRRVGVSPTAAYRHFADRQSLLAAVAQQARESLADAMVSAVAEVPGRSGRRRAFARLQATGRAYVRFALAEPGLFRTGFAGFGPAWKGEQVAQAGQAATPGDAGGSAAEPRGDRAYAVLTAALDELVDTGALPAARRPGAEAAAWSAVHGLSLLLLDEVLVPAGTDPEPVIELTLRMVADGL